MSGEKIEPVVFELSPDTAKAEKEIDEFFEGVAGGAVPVIDVIGAIGVAWNGVTAAVGFARDVVTEAFQASLEGERVERQITAALTARGAETERLTSKLLGFNDELERQTNLSAETLTGMQAQAIALGVLPQHIETVTRASAGWASLTGKDLHGALRDVAALIEGRIPKALTKLHPEIRTTGEALRFMTSGLELTRAEAQSTEGLLAGISIEVENLSEDMGGAISKSPEFRALLRDTKDLVSDAREEFAQLNADGHVDKFFGGIRTGMQWVIDHGAIFKAALTHGATTAATTVAGLLPGGALAASVLAGGIHAAEIAGWLSGNTPPPAIAAPSQPFNSETPIGIGLPDILDGSGTPRSVTAAAGGKGAKSKSKKPTGGEMDDAVAAFYARGAAARAAEIESVTAFNAAILELNNSQAQYQADLQAMKTRDLDFEISQAAARHELRAQELKSVDEFGGQLIGGLEALANNTAAMNASISSELGSMALGFGSAIGAGLANAIGAIVDGSKGIGAAFADLAANIFTTLGTQLISMAAVLGILTFFNPALGPIAGAMGAAGVVAIGAGALVRRAANGGGGGGGGAVSVPSGGGGGGSPAGFTRFGSGGDFAAGGGGGAPSVRVLQVVFGAGAIITDTRKQVGRVLHDIGEEYSTSSAAIAGRG